MSRLIGPPLRSLSILAAFTLSVILLASAVSAQMEDLANELSSIEEPGPGAIGFKIWTNKEKGEAFNQGDRAVIYLRAEEQAYVTVLVISADGTVTVALPNKTVRDTMILANRLYGLFGEDSPVLLTAGETSDKTKLVVYLSPTQLVLDPLTIPEGKTFLTLAGKGEKDLLVIRDKLRTMAGEPKFNRATVSLCGTTGANLDVTVTQAPEPRKLDGFSKDITVTPPPKALKRMGIPPDGELPETLTGSAGLKPLPEDKPHQ